MRYPGSKYRHADELVYLLSRNRKSDQAFVEPFVGSASICCKMEGIRYANDTNPYLIAMLKAISEGWEPPTSVSEEFYYKIKDKPNKFDPALVGFVAHSCSFAGIWWGGYARGVDSFGNSRNYCLEARNKLLKIKKRLVGVIFSCGNYSKMRFPSKSLVYCDPPYKDTQSSYFPAKFNSTKFWNWAKRLSELGHTVFVSEYSIPSGIDARLIWNKCNIASSLDIDTGGKRADENLYLLGEIEDLFSLVGY